MDVKFLLPFQTALFDAPRNAVSYTYHWINLDSSRLSPKMNTRGNSTAIGRVLKLTIVSILIKMVFLKVSVLCNSSVGINGNHPRYYAISPLAFLEFGFRIEVGRRRTNCFYPFCSQGREQKKQ